jgi:hypothetical protein
LEGIILYDLLEMIFVPVNFAAMEMLKNRMWKLIQEVENVYDSTKQVLITATNIEAFNFFLELSNDANALSKS